MKPCCLYCYEPLTEGEVDFHPKCSKAFFGTTVAPVLPYTPADWQALALQIIRANTNITGVQPKLLLSLDSQTHNTPPRLTVVGLWGTYILKPPTEQYPFLPEVESLSMKLAQVLGINTVPHTLIRLQSGELAYLTKRIDRQGTQKIAMEDMCQLTEKMTEQKYNGSYEQIAKSLLRYATNPQLDIQRFYEVVLFSFLTGNADMHLKNFSIIKTATGYALSPAYDLVATRLLLPEDKEELALTLNAKKNRIKAEDFRKASQPYLSEKVWGNILRKWERQMPLLFSLVNQSFLPENLKEQYIGLLRERWVRLNGDTQAE